MKKLLIVLLAITMLAGCAGITDFLYGPDLTPEELRSQVYADSYAIGAIFAKDKNALEIAQMVGAANTDYQLVLMDRFVSALDEGDMIGAIASLAMSRILSRIGFLRNADGVWEAVGVDRELLAYSAQGYIAGCLSRQAVQ